MRTEKIHMFIRLTKINSAPSRLFLLSLLLGLSYTAQGADLSGKALVTQGNGRGATACQTCHGKRGMGNADAGYPYLAGLPAAYIENQLNAFKTGRRKNSVMKPMASALSKKEMSTVAAYYANLDNPLLDNPADQSTAAGNPPDLLQNGKWQAGMPACYSCHGPKGHGIPPHFPPLAGQPYDYLKNQLIAWKQGKRVNDPVKLMQSVARALTREEIDMLARYLSRQDTP